MIRVGKIILEMQGISKAFPGVQALSEVNFQLREGEVHALLGENGAGKSTLMKILTGIYQRDGGKIIYLGREIDVPDTKTAQSLGISIIHQELNLAPDLTVAQNIFIGREPKKGLNLFLDEKELNKRTKNLFDRLNIDLNPQEKVRDLTVAMQQMVEIAKALSFDSKVLIMDEPTAALTDSEINSLFTMIKKLRDDGVGIIYISHRMEELKKITDRATVMRDGQYINTVTTKDTTIDKIISMMVGRQISQNQKPEFKNQNGHKVLEVRNLSSGKSVKNVSFDLLKGEILGFAGLMGAGRTEVARTIFGADPLDSGEILINGTKVNIKNPSDAVQNGIGYLSEDRKQYGLMLEMDIKANITISSMKDFLRFNAMLNQPKIHRKSYEMVDTLKIKTPSINQYVKNLSGGNQQKVIIAKWLTKDSDILIFDEPTRGIDIGAKDEIYNLLNDLANQGKSIIMISSELPEILRMSHRIIVMSEGRITGELINDENATQETIMSLATKRIS